MSEEQTKESPFPLSPDQRDEFKIAFAFAVNGILGSIPFGVTVDPNAIANAGRSVALSMLSVQQEVCGE